MLTSILLLSLMADPQSNRPTSEEMYAYEQARAEAGRDAEAHVQLALWCERHGLSARRLEHLALALMADPAHATARGLMGMVRDAETWRRPEQVARRVKSDADRAAALAEYNARRDKTPMTADEQWDLALWCEQHGLAPEATAHLTAVVRLDPSREAAWKRLGCRKYKGRWLTEEQIKASIAEAEAQEKADRHWIPKLSALKERLHHSDRERREEADRELASITDPRAVPAIWRVFLRGKAPDPTRAVQLLAQIDSTAASKALAAVAVFGPTPEQRRMATEALTWRDPREFLDLLILQIRKPLQYEVRPVNGPGATGVLFVEGLKYNIRKNYVTPEPTNLNSYLSIINSTNDFGIMSTTMPGGGSPARGLLRRRFGAPVTPGEFAIAQAFQQAAANPANALSLLSGAAQGQAVSPSPTTNTRSAARYLAGLKQAYRDELALRQAQAIIAHNRNEIRRSTIAAQQQLEHDIAAVEATNAAYHQLNERVLPILDHLTGQELGEDPEAWAKWWSDQQGYAYQTSTTKPTFVQQAPIAYQPALIRLHHSCFAAGTLVRTLGGTSPIETIQVGDRLLTQDPETGALAFEPVVAVFHNPPNKTFRIGMGGESVVATGIHRFWKAGKGWTMARDLKPGDTIRTLHGLESVESVSADKIQPVFNLEVARGHSFFVGEAGILVHDNSLIETVDHPFDATPALARLSKGRK